MFTWQRIHRHLWQICGARSLWYLPHFADALVVPKLHPWNFRLIVQLKEVALRWKGCLKSMVGRQIQAYYLRTGLHDPASFSVVTAMVPPLSTCGLFSLTFPPPIPSRSVTSPPGFYLLLHADLFKTAINFLKGWIHGGICESFVLLPPTGLEAYRGNV